MTTSDERVFVDTNVLVYANVAESAHHEWAIQKMDSLWSAGTELWLSRQVLREYLVVVTRPQTFASAPPLEVTLSRVQYYLETFEIAEDGTGVTQLLLQLIKNIPIGGKQIHDANIVATMQAYRIPRLLTRNTADFERYTHLITLLPLE